MESEEVEGVVVDQGPGPPGVELEVGVVQVEVDVDQAVVFRR